MGVLPMRYLVISESSALYAAVIGICMYPGAMQFPRTPWEAHSLLKAFVICRTAPFVAEYMLVLKPVWNEVTEAMLTTFPVRPSPSTLRPNS